MMVKPTDKIIGYNGDVITDQNGNEITIREAIVNALNYVTQDSKITPEDKQRIFDISIKLYLKEELDFSVDERAFILKMAGENLIPLVYGRLKEILDK